MSSLPLRCRLNIHAWRYTKKQYGEVKVIEKSCMGCDEEHIESAVPIRKA